MKYAELIKSYISSNHDSSILESWIQKTANQDTELDNLAICLGKLFVAGEISFDNANDILNDLMPIKGFEEAPIIFWKLYEGFENFEGVEDPDQKAKSVIEEILKEINTI